MVGEVIVGDNWAFFTVMVDILLLHPFVCVDIVINAPFDSFHEYIVQYRADIPSVSTFQVSRMGKVHKLKKKVSQSASRSSNSFLLWSDAGQIGLLIFLPT